MHELSLVEELVEACAERAGGQAVEVVRVRRASTLPEESLRQAFEALTVGGPLAGARLSVEEFAVRLECGCGFCGDLGHDDVVSSTLVVCPRCGDVSTRPRTAELELLEVRLAQHMAGA